MSATATPKPRKLNPAEQAEKRRRQVADILRAQTAAAQEIAPLPDVADPERREACRLSFRAFCETYFGSVFTLEWSADHLYVIEQIEQTVLTGQNIAIAMPRGSGKTSLCTVAVLWAALYAHARFIVLIAANKDKAVRLVTNIMTWIETMPDLTADFPEVCYPAAKLERIVHRQKGQKYNGEPTRINWSAQWLTFPTVGKPTDGVTIVPCGLAGADIRGLQYVNAAGEIVRPDLALIDDPQTRESAKSRTQTLDRLGLLQADVLKMAGPGKALSALCTVTVIFPDDLADQILDRKRNPVWRGVRKKLVYQFPKNLALWEKYGELRQTELISDAGRDQSNAFYAEHRAEMDEGAQVAWPQRFNADQLSALQFAMDARLADELSFASEYQNEPFSMVEEGTQIEPEEVVKRVSFLPRRVLPAGAVWITAHIDVHQNLLYYTCVAWDRAFGGSVVDYGTVPEQPRAWFALNDANPTLSDRFPGAGFEGSIYAGLNEAVNRLAEPMMTESGEELTIDRILIDANWGNSRDIVYQFCKKKAAETRIKITPAHGVYHGATREPFASYRPKPTDWIGLNWRMPGEVRQGCRYLLFDTNYWKSFVAARLAAATGDPGSLSLFGTKPARHALYADHLAAEKWQRVEAAGRAVNEWRLTPGRDNHFLDTLVGSAVAAAMCGAKPPALAPKTDAAGPARRPAAKTPAGSSAKPKQSWAEYRKMKTRNTRRWG